MSTFIGSELNGVDSFERQLQERISWLEEKENMMRDPTNSDYTPNPLCIGRVQGQIGGVKETLAAYTKARRM